MQPQKSCFWLKKVLLFNLNCSSYYNISRYDRIPDIIDRIDIYMDINSGISGYLDTVSDIRSIPVRTVCCIN